MNVSEKEFLKENSFECEKEITLDAETRVFVMSADSRFYFTPECTLPMRIYDAKKITRVDIMSDTEESPFADFMLRSTIGANPGSANKKSNIYIKAEFDDYKLPVCIIKIMQAKRHKTSHQYVYCMQKAQEIKDMLLAASAKQTDMFGELTCLKKLLDDGVITREDFEKKKKQILGI